MQETVAPRRVGERLRELRNQRGISQRGFAPLINVSHATVSKWETGNAPIDADLLPTLAEVLGVHPADFFEGGTLNHMLGDDIAEEFRAFVGEKIDQLPPHEQRAVALAVGIANTLLARAG